MNVNDRQVVVDVLVEFFEIVINNVIFVRKLYPNSIFELKKKYGVCVYQIIHPGVRKYLNDCLKAVAFHCKRKQLQRLFVCFESDETIIDRFVFDLLNYTELNDSDHFYVELEQCFRSFILKLHSSEIYLPELSSNATFSIRLHTTFSSTVEFNEDAIFEDFPWIEETKSEHLSEDETSIIPLYTIQTKFMNLQMFIERQ